MTSELPRRDRPVTIRLTGPQYNLIREAQYIDSASDWDKVTLSEWIRRILIQESERIVEDYARACWEVKSDAKVLLSPPKTGL